MGEEQDRPFSPVQCLVEREFSGVTGHLRREGGGAMEQGNKQAVKMGSVAKCMLMKI
jgi:hypothetical protein